MARPTRFQKVAGFAVDKGTALLKTVKDATAKGTVKYWQNKDTIDPWVTAVSLGLVGTGAAADALQMGYFESLAVSAAAGAATHSADVIAPIVNEDIEPLHEKVLNTGLTYGAALGVSAAGSSFVLNGLSIDGMAQYMPDSLVLGALGYAGLDVLRGVFKASEKVNTWTEDRPAPTTSGQMTRRKFLSAGSKSLASLAMLGSVGAAGMDSLERLTNGRGRMESTPEVPTYVRLEGERMLRVTPLTDDSYESIARDFSLEERAQEIADVTERAGNGFAYIPVDLLREEFQDLDQESVKEFLVPGGSLWGLAEEYLGPPGAKVSVDQYPEERERLIRIMQRVSNLPDETNIETTAPVIIPRSYIFEGRMEPAELQRRFEEETAGDTAVLPEPAIGELSIDRTYFNLNATTPRKRTDSGPVFKPDMILYHTTESPAGNKSENVTASISRKKSAHYVIGRDGTVFMTIDPRFHADGAGESLWRGRHYLNTYSINIEIDAKIEDDNQQPINDAQYASLRVLTQELRDRFDIPTDMVLGHNQVAFSERWRTRGRKGDPGNDFDWRRAGLPNNYNIIDPDVLAGRVRPNPDMEKEGRRWNGYERAFDRLNQEDEQ